MNAAAIPFVALLALAQLIFVWNLVQTLRGATTAATRRRLLTGVVRPRLTSASIQGFAIVVTLVVIVGLGAAGWAIGRSSSDAQAAGFAPEAPPAATAPTPGEPPAAGPDGAAVFASAGCGGCHTLAAAGSTGTVGPSLDASPLTAEQAAQVITSGRNAMPAFGGRLSDEEIQAVAAYATGEPAP
jgi:mono/diheme cytochrome c family protein